MRPSRSARLVLAIFACAAALSAPATAVAHGMAHMRELVGDSLPIAVDATNAGNFGTVSPTDADADHSALHRVPVVRQTERQTVPAPVARYRLPAERPAARRVEIPRRETVGEPIPPPGARIARPRAPPVG